MSDVIDFAQVELPAVALVTEKFADEAIFVARARGMPDAPWLQLPHPVAGIGDPAMRALATDLVPRLIASFRGAR